MTTPIYPLDVSTTVTVTTANAIASNAYAVAADKLTLDGTGTSLYADFSLVPATMIAPVTGSFCLMAVDYSIDGTTAGPAPTTTLLGRFVGAFTPMPNASNALTTWAMSIQNILVTRKTDFYIFNNGTGQSLPSGSVLKAQRWTPST